MARAGDSRASDVNPQAVRWLWRERIPMGMMTLVAGRPGGGKSAFLTHLAATVSHQHGVILSNLEDPKREVVRPRLQAADANLTRIHLRTLRLPNDLGLPGAVGSLEREIEELGVKLVVMDPIAAHLQRGVSRFNDSIRTVTNRLESIGERTGCAFVFADHVVKHFAAKSHPLLAIGGGGSGLAAAVRMAYLIGKDPDDDERVLLCPVKSNLRDNPPALAFLPDARTFVGTDGREGTAGLLLPREECEFDARRLLSVPTDERKRGRPPEKRAEAARWLTNYLFVADEHEAPMTQIEEDARQYAITLKTLKRAATDMGVIKAQRAVDGQRGWWWKLPQELIDARAEEDGG